MHTPLCLLLAAFAVYAAPPPGGGPYKPNAEDAPTGSLSFNVTKLNYTDQLGYILSQYYDGMPHSYSTPDQYWSSEDYLSSDIEKQLGALDNQTAIQDRTCTKFGLNLYDGATFTIAATLMGASHVSDMYMRSVLYLSSTCMAEYGEKCAEDFPEINGLKNIRADTEDYLYGAEQVPGSSLGTVLEPGNHTSGEDVYRPGAFYYRMISPRYLVTDPILGPYATSFKAPTPDSDGPQWDTFGAIHWNDWKPITGENAWAALIGPLQTMFLQSNGTVPEFKDIKSAPDQVKMALSVLPAFKALLSSKGSLYHCPAGTKMYPPDPEDEATNVSNENNFSSYAGLKMLRWILATGLTVANSEIADVMKDLDKIISGLESFFKMSMSLPLHEDDKWRVFYQGGHVPFDQGKAFEPVELYVDPQALAVDCQTWAVAAVGAETIDKWHGNGTAYYMWKATKALGGYYHADGTLGGVGYTNHTEVGKGAINRPHDVWSAEWTFGAILMTQLLGDYYEKSNPEWSKECWADAGLMEKSLWKQFKGSKYNTTVDSDPGGMINPENGGFMYANVRFFIPWGWYANAISSLCSTSWAIWSQFKTENGVMFNPFRLGGGIYGQAN